MPNTFFPFAQNVRAYEDGQIGPRPLLSDALEQIVGAAVNSIFRLIDTTPLGPPSGFTHIFGGNNGSLWAGSVNSLPAGNLSGLRLALCPYRPDQSPQPWVYVGDRNKLVKVRSDGTLYKTGIAEPQIPATAIVGATFQYEVVGDFDNATPWKEFGTGLAPVRVAFPGPIVQASLYDSGGVGLCSLVFPVGTTAAQVPVDVLVYAGLPNLVFLEAFIAAPSNTTIGTITYDSGTTGPCTIVTSTLPSGLGQNSIFQLGAGEYVRVESFVAGLASATIRVRTVTTHVAGEAMTGHPSARADSPSGGAITSISFVWMSQLINTGVGGMQETIPVNTGVLSTFFGSRPVQPSDDLRFIVDVETFQANITKCVITLNVDPNVIDFATNAFQWTILGAAFSNTSVSNVLVSVANLTGTLTSGTGRLGTNTALDLTTGVNGIKIEWTCTGPLNNANMYGLNLVGNYGPNGSGANTPIVYRYRYRSAEGAKSNPSPPMRIGVTPANGSVEIQTTASTDPQVKWIDIFRDGGTLTNYTYIGTVPNNNPPPAFIDAQDDLAVVNNPQLEFDNFEPFPSIDLPATGVVNISQYTVTWVSGTKFNPLWGPGTLITIGGVTYTLYNRPQSATQLTVVENGGTQFNVPYQIPQPTLLAQPLPALWGPTDNTGFFFACGDPLRPGTLYFTKGNNPDSAPDTNQIEATSPSEPLMNGVLVNGLGMVFSTERAWWIYPNYATVTATVTGTVGSPFTLIEAISNRGLYCLRGVCTDGGSTVFFISKDGIYMATQGAGAICITDSIFSLFPHENSTQQPILIGGTTVQPPDFTYPDGMSLSFSEGRLYFDYNYFSQTTRPWSLVFDMRTLTWSVDVQTVNAWCHATQFGVVNLVSAPVSGKTGTLVGCGDGSVREFSPSGTESFTSIIQREYKADGALGFEHAKNMNVKYQGGPLTLQLTPDQGQVPPPVMIPAAASQIKSLFGFGANKFKLLQYAISMAVSPGNTFRLWASGAEAKQGEWGREGPYKPIQPFNDFAKATTTTTTTTTSVQS